MRQIQVFVSNDDREDVLGALDEIPVEYALARAADDEGVIAYVSVPTGAVEGVLADLREAGLDGDSYTAVKEIEESEVTDDGLTEEYVKGPSGTIGVSYEELRTRADGLRPARPVFIALAALSAVVASAGLLLNSAVVLVGSMVIAPFTGSALAASVGAVAGDRDLVVRSAASQTLGLVVGFLAAAGFAAALQAVGYVPSALSVAHVEQIESFVAPSLVAIVIALCAGTAGALGVATDLPVSIAGVAVSAALVPSVAAAALGAAWQEPSVVAGGVALLFVNNVLINLTASITLVALGYDPSLIEAFRDESFSVGRAAYALVVVGFALALAVTAVATYDHVRLEHDAVAAVESTLDRPAYEALELRGVTVTYDAPLVGDPTVVTVTVAHPGTGRYPRLPERIRARLASATDRNVSVRVESVGYHRADGSTGETRRSASPGAGRIGPPSVLGAAADPRPWHALSR